MQAAPRPGALAGGMEDVGRHVALDKLLGQRAGEGEAWRSGAALVSSRASYEMVQKAAGPRGDARSTISYPRRRERLPPGVRRRSCASSRRAASSPAV